MGYQHIVVPIEFINNVDKTHKPFFNLILTCEATTAKRGIETPRTSNSEVCSSRYGLHKKTEVDHNIRSRIETLKKKVSEMIISKTENLLAKVDLIDSIFRLGVNYHFEDEIDEVLQQIHKNFVVNREIFIEANLAPLAVLFRLLREHGFHVSPLVFNKFLDVQGNFSERLFSDVEGMLCLYEASHMMVHGEDILEVALAFTSTHLKSIVTTLSPSLATQVNHSLRKALHKNLPRLEARRYISIYEQHPSHNKILLTLAKLDFNKLQDLHQKEFGNICK
ncbi:hypothetical protein Fmac_021356 [Flemingia macrophylla]|uniref:Terpene synthase N-terminal domain-containing protein n=1 Tax=Flemingia macrophylla TaxID=520843 RepID=A0ABD1LWP2_9FABA